MAKALENLAKNAKTMKVLLDVMQEDHLSKSDFTEHFKMVVDALKEQLDSIRVANDEYKNGLSSENQKSLQSFKSELSQTLARLESIVNDAKKTSESDRRTTMRYVDQKMQDLEALIEYYDDSNVYSEIEKVRSEMPKMPKEFDPTEIYEQHEEMKRQIEDLKSRPVGGVTNARIQQAFKYILKTEQPVGDIDGANDTYTVSQPIFAVLAMSLNGEVIAELPNYTINGNSFTFSTALPAAYSGKDFEIKYV